jgi:alpha-tubulin suppressor-like RCC1 family protein
MLGDGTTTSKNTPISPNVGTGNIIQIASIGGGAGNLFVLKASGDLYGCGYNGYGMLGVGDTLQKNTPIIINTGVAKILRPNYATASFEHWTQAFIKKSDGTYFAAGKNDYGECGVGSTSNTISTWTKMPFPDKTNIIDIYSYVASASACIAMAVTDDGRIYGWGHGTDRGVLSSMTAPIRSPIKINFTK